MNKRLKKTLVSNKSAISKIRSKRFVVDAYNEIIVENIAPTITTGISFRNTIFVGVKNEKKKD